MAKIANPKSLPTLLLLLFIPLWVSEVLRAFAWWIILAPRGPLNALLLAIGAIEKPVRWIVDYDGVVIGLTYTYVLFMLFPIYNATRPRWTPTRSRRRMTSARRGGKSTSASFYPMPNPVIALGRGDGVYAVGRLLAGALDPWVDHFAVVHLDAVD
ncbi:MAG: hypothetical protein U5N55_05640 [Cypionkella sp.]|nr:hypothetical protein [Cypionkella sp.]